MRPSVTASENGANRRTAALRQMTADELLDLGTRPGGLPTSRHV